MQKGLRNTLIAIAILIVLFGGLFNSDTDSETENKDTEVSQNENVVENNQQSETDYKAECKEYNYKNVLRYPESYIGNKIVITVKISTVKSENLSTPTKYYFAYSESEPGSGFYYGDRYAIFDKRSNQDNLKLLEDDVIRVWGEIVEPEETTSLIVNSEELFCIDMKYVELISE